MKIDPRITDPGKRYDFLLLFDVTDGNPNGDPDAGNLPRIDPETMQGIVTDVCLKRKIRNYVDLVHGANYDELDRNERYGIFVRDSGVALNTKLRAALVSANEIEGDVKEVESDSLTGSAESDDTDATSKKKAKGGKVTQTRVSGAGRVEMCRRYFDVRAFGGVLTTGKFVGKDKKSYVTCGQVRGPIQFTFAKSVDPVVPVDWSITRVAITKEGEGKDTEMGRKAQVPYGLYVAKGYFSPMLAKDTGLDQADLETFWQAVANMFEHDRSAARGDMRLQQVFIFRHEDPLGNAHAGKLFDRVDPTLKGGVAAPREFDDYEVKVDEVGLPEGVTLVRLLG